MNHQENKAEKNYRYPIYRNAPKMQTPLQPQPQPQHHKTNMGTRLTKKEKITGNKEQKRQTT